MSVARSATRSAADGHKQSAADSRLGHRPRPNLLTRTANFAPFVPAVSTSMARSVRFGRRAFLVSAARAGARRRRARRLKGGGWGEGGVRGGGGLRHMPKRTVASHRVRVFHVLDPESRRCAVLARRLEGWSAWGLARQGRTALGESRPCFCGPRCVWRLFRWRSDYRLEPPDGASPLWRSFIALDPGG
jgi:hypothetical protein